MKPTHEFSSRKRCVGRWGLVLATVLCAQGAPQAEESGIQDFDIPPQSLGGALNAYADKAGVELSYPSGLAAGLKSGGAHGHISNSQALEQILAGTGVLVSTTRNGTTTLRKAPEAPKSDPPRKPARDTQVQALPVVKVSSRGDDERGSLTAPSIAYSRERLARVPGGTTLIEGERLKEGTLFTVNDALAYSPGVYVGDQGAGISNGSYISIRGSDVNSRISPLRGLKLLRNGLPLTYGNGESDTESINLNAIHDIEIYRGANALEYGASNLGGAINFVTPTGYTANRLRAGFNWGTNGYVNPTLSGGGVLGHGWDAYGSFSYMKYNGNRDKTEQELFFGYGNIGYRWNENHETRLHLDIQNHNSLFAAALTQEQLQRNPHQNPGTNKPPTGYPWYRVDLQHSIKLDDGDRFDIGAYYVNQDWSWFIGDFGLFRDLWQDTGFSWRHQINGQLFGLPNRVTWGGLSQWMSINDRNFWESDFSIPGPPGTIPLQGNERDKWNNVEAYLEDQLSLSDAFALVVGGQVNYRKGSFIRKFPVEVAGMPNQADQDFFNFNPKLGFTWQATREAQFYGNISRSSEPPPLIDLADIYKQPRLTSQTGTTLEIGTRGHANRLRWDAAFYHSWLNNELLIVPIPPNFNTFTTTNAGKTQHTGIELGLEDELPLGIAAVDDSLRLRGSYTWSRFEFDGDPKLGSNRLPGIPEHNARFEALYMHPSGFYAGPNVTVVGSKWVDFTNTLAAKPYTLLGARIGWDDGKHWKLYLDGRNLTNERYAASVYVMPDAQSRDAAQFSPGATRMVFGGVEYRF